MSDDIEIPFHLSGCKNCRCLYRLLFRAYSFDRGASHDRSPDQEELCDNCGVTACGGDGM